MRQETLVDPRTSKTTSAECVECVSKLKLKLNGKE